MIANLVPLGLFLLIWHWDILIMFHFCTKTYRFQVPEEKTINRNTYIHHLFISFRD